MKIKLLVVGTRMPDWVVKGVQEYSKRLPSDFALNCHEIPLARREKNASEANIQQAMRKESEGLLGHVDVRDHVVAMEVQGKALSTRKLADRLDAIRADGRNLCLLVGGPDGLDEICRKRADEEWSLSALTLPHPLVRIVLAEQIYRAWSVLNNHPYHRE